MMKKIKRLSIRNGSLENWTEFYIIKIAKINKSKLSLKINQIFYKMIFRQRIFLNETYQSINNMSFFNIKISLSQIEIKDYFLTKNSRFKKINKNQINFN